jgi:hypothetical protein
MKGDPWPSTSGRTSTSPAYKSPQNIQTTPHYLSRPASTGPPSPAALSTSSTALSSVPCGGPTLTSSSCASTTTRAYEEALRSGGLLEYFKGHANDRGECLSFCLWETRDQARKAAKATSHNSAADITAQMYLSYMLDRYWLKKAGENLIFEPIAM